MHLLICSLLEPRGGRREGVVLLPCVFVEGELLGCDVESAGALFIRLTGYFFPLRGRRDHDDDDDDEKNAPLNGESKVLRRRYTCSVSF